MADRAALAAVAIKVDAAEGGADEAVSFDHIARGSIDGDDFARRPEGELFLAAKEMSKACSASVVGFNLP